MYVRNQWYVAARSTEIGRTPMQRWLLDEPYVLYRTEAGDPVVLDDRCPHRRFALSKGRLQGDVLQCGYHGLAFGPDGACVGIPGQDKIPSQIRARAVPVVERHRWIWVWPGDPEKADAAVIPDFHWMDEPGWTCSDDYRRIDCHYRLLVDNLLDLTHETFVHTATIGHAELAAAPIEARRDDDLIRIDRIVPDCAPPPLFAKAAGFTGNIDRYQFIRHQAPSFVWIDARAVATGSNDLDSGLRWEVLNAITPATADETHYFWGLSRHFNQDDDDLTRMLHGAVEQTFDEDTDVLETQHQMMKSDPPDYPFVHVDADRGVVLARRLLEERLAAEQAGTA